jgi:AraC-like DNA-binding protein
MNNVIKEYKPSPELSPYVEFFWTGIFNINSVDNYVQRVVPNGYVELIIHLSDDHCELLQRNAFSPSPDYTLIGLFTEPYDVHFRKSVSVFGIRLKPEGVYHVFGMPASEIHKDFADMEIIAGKHFRKYCLKLREQNQLTQMIFLTEEYLRRNVSNNKLNLYYLNHAAEMIRMRKGKISINDLAGKVYISSRQLEREFRQKIGLSPKSYMRIARLNEVNRRINSGNRIDLTHLSHSIGYSDQAHFIRDFKCFTGESPKVFINQRENFIVNPNASELVELQ